MSNEQFDNNRDAQSGDEVRPATPTGIEISGTDEQEISTDTILNSGVVPPKIHTAEVGVSPAMTDGISNSGVVPSGGCSCGGVGGECTCNPPQLVFAIGELGYDLLTEARKDSLWQAMGDNPHDWKNLEKHLKNHAWDASDVTWTLRIDATPIYAIQPAGPFAAGMYELLLDMLMGQIDSNVNYERISIPGMIAGSTTLSNGISVPMLIPSRRGMYAWDTKSLVDSVTTKAEKVTEGVQNFFERVYYELRNLGQSPQERAINFAATNAFQISHVFKDAINMGQELDVIEVVKSPICRQDSDCWDVMLTFFNPQNDRAARVVHRFTIDVSDVVPCTVGRVRRWSLR